MLLLHSQIDAAFSLELDFWVKWFNTIYTQTDKYETRCLSKAFIWLLGEFKQIRAIAIARVYICCNDPISAGISSSSPESLQKY